ncbi:MAG: cation-transporting ATPase [Methylococcus sp.]
MISSSDNTVSHYEWSREDADVFSPAAYPSARLFARRVLAMPEVDGLTMEFGKSRARLSYVAPSGQRQAVLNRLADAIQGLFTPLAEEELPDWPEEETVRWVRGGGRLTRLLIDDSATGRLVLTHSWLPGANNPLSHALGRRLRSLPGVRGVEMDEAAGRLRVLYSPARITPDRIIRAIETVFRQSAPPHAVANPAEVPMTLSNTLVGLSTVGELLLPVATPAAAGILVLNHLGTAREAVVQLGRGKVGVPLFYSALLTCSIVTGQVLAFALTDWSLRYWQRRWRKQLTDETQSLVEDCLPPAVQVRLIDEAGRESLLDASTLRAGQTLRIFAGESIPADGPALRGEALVDESPVTGACAPRRKGPGDEVLAGTRILAGRLDIVAERLGAETRAGKLAREIMGIVAGIPGDPRLREKAVGLADNSAMPTLATAGVGWLAGDLITVGAILHQDWISGPELAVPLLTLHHLRAALAHGALVQHPAAIPRLGECDFLVLDGDDSRLMTPPLELSAVASPVADTDTLLTLAAGAGLYLGGDIAAVLADACQRQGLIVRQPELLDLEPDGVLVRQGGRQVRLQSQSVGAGILLQLDIDAQPVAELTLQPGVMPAMAETVGRLKSLGLQVFLMASAPEAATRERAEALGIALSGGDLDHAAKLRFLEGLRRRGIKAMLAGPLAGQAELARSAHVNIDVPHEPCQPGPADILLMNGGYNRLASLLETARGFQPDLHRSTRMATIPNLLCIAGAFGGLLNGITSGIIANMGVANVDRQLRRQLELGKHRRVEYLARLPG